MSDLSYRATLPPPDDVDEPLHRCCLGIWYIHSREHPVWAWHAMSLCHLRDIGGTDPKPRLASPGMTHELVVAAVRPELELQLEDRVPWPTMPDGKGCLLHPLNIVHQFQAPTDVSAERVAMGMFAARAQLVWEPQGVWVAGKPAREAWAALATQWAAACPRAGDISPQGYCRCGPGMESYEVDHVLWCLGCIRRRPYAPLGLLDGVAASARCPRCHLCPVVGKVECPACQAIVR